MKHLTIVIGGILLTLNLLIGLLISSYSWFNICVTSGVIILSFALIEALKYAKVSDAFRVSLIFVFVFLMLVCFILGVLSPQSFKDNWYIISIIIIVAIEVILLLSTRFISQNVKS